MVFAVIFNSPWIWKRMATYLFVTLTYTGYRMASWVIKSTENLPTLTSTWTLDQTTIPPTYKPFIQPWCTQTGLCVTRKASTMSWSSSLPLSGKLAIVSNRYDGSSTRQLEPQSRKTSSSPSLLFHIPRRHTAGSAECWPNTISNVTVCRLGRSPVSVVRLRPGTEDNRSIQHTMWVWSCAHRTDWSIHRDQKKRTPPTHTVWTSRHIGGGRTYVHPQPSHKIPRHPEPSYCTRLHGPNYQGGGWVGAPP